jgi:hypothetical protein
MENREIVTSDDKTDLSDRDDASKYGFMTIFELISELKRRDLAISNSECVLASRVTDNDNSASISSTFIGEYETKVRTRDLNYYELIRPYISSLPDILRLEMQSETAKLSLANREWNDEAKCRTVLLELESLDMVATEKHIESKFINVVTANNPNQIRHLDNQLARWFVLTYPHLSYLMTKTDLNMKFLALKMNKLDWLTEKDVKTMINANVDLVAEYIPSLEFAITHCVAQQADSSKFVNWPMFLIEYGLNEKIIDTKYTVSALKEFIIRGEVEKFELVYKYAKPNSSDRFRPMDLVKSALAGNYKMVTTIFEKYLSIYRPNEITLLYSMLFNELLLTKYTLILLNIIKINNIPINGIQYLLPSMNVVAIKNLLSKYNLNTPIENLEEILEHFTTAASKKPDEAMEILELLQSIDERTYKSFARLSTISVELMSRLMAINPRVMQADPYIMLYNAIKLGGIPEVLYVLTHINPSIADITKANEFANSKSLLLIADILLSELISSR